MRIGSNIATSVSGTMLDAATVLWQLSGNGAQGAIGTVSWQLPSGGDFIKNYVVTSTSGSVTQMAAGDFTGTTLTTYGVADLPGAVVKLNITAELVGIGDVTFQTETEINFQKPGQSIFNAGGAFKVSGTQSMPLLNSTALYDQMSYSIATGPGAVGTVSYVQLVNYDHTYTDAFGNLHELASGTTPELDTSYPYSSGPGSADYPLEPLGGLRAEVSVNDSFQTWLMWTPPGDNSIPVPIQEFSWNWGAVASWGWYFVGGIDPDPAPGSTTVPVVSSNTVQYPTWTAVFHVGFY